MAKPYKRKSNEEKEKEVNELIERANVGIENCFTTPEQVKELASYMSRFYNYSLRNTFLIQEQFRGALAVGSYAFWKEKGFVVNKGEKGIKILVPNKLSDYFINEKGEEVKLKDANLEEKKLIEQGEIEVRQGKLIFNQGYVFEVSQTNAKAEDLPKIFPNRWLDGEIKNYDLMYKAMENIAKKIGVKIIEQKDELGAVKGVSYPATKEVALNPRNTQLQNVKTLIHELTHAKLHTMETRDNYTTNAKEFQAEMATYVVCSYFGLDTSEYSFRYIRSWTKNVELKDKEKLINEVRETVKEYIEVIEKTLVNDKDLSLSLENENLLEKKIEDEKLINFLGKDRVVIKEITRDELENIINENNSNIFLQKDKELNIKNEVVAIEVKGKYTDVYIGENYDLNNLIYIDDDKNLYKVKEEKIHDKNLYEMKEQEVMRDDIKEFEVGERYITNKNYNLEDGSFIKKGTSFYVISKTKYGYNIEFENNKENYFENDTRKYYIDEFDLEDFANPEVHIKGVVENTQEIESDDWKLSDKDLDKVSINVMKNPIELQRLYKEWSELVGRENWCKLQLAGDDVTFKPTEYYNIQARKDFTEFAKLESEITVEEMLNLEKIYREEFFQNLSKMDNLEEYYKIENNKEYETLFDLELKDGSFIKGGTSFMVEGLKDGKYQIHFSEREGNIYIPDNGTGDMYYFNEFEIEKFTDLSKGKVIFEEKEVVNEVEQVRENNDWKLTDKEIAEADRLVELEAMKENIEKLMKENYGDFIRAIISIEIGIEDIELLDNIYEEYMDKDFKFINDKFEELKNELGNEAVEMRDEKKEKDIWRKIREHEEWVKSNGLRGQKLNLENENLKGMRLINLDLREANFRGVDMTQCIVFADLRGADLTDIKIDNSEWIGSNINNVTIEANKLNLIEYQMEQEKELHLASMDMLKTKTKEKEMSM